MRRFHVLNLVALLGWLCTAAPLWSQVTPIGPFSGTVFEDFNVFPFNPSYQQYSIFGGQGLVKNIHPSGALKYEASSTRGGDTVLPRSAPTFGGQIGISEWTFPQPLLRFGAYWENNSRFDDAVATFYDTGNNLIGTLNMTISKDANIWQWNGWQFDTPVSKFVITGNDTAFFSGFIWYEDATANFTVAVPEPSTWALLGLAAIGAGVAGFRSWRRSRKNDWVLEEQA